MQDLRAGQIVYDFTSDEDTITEASLKHGHVVGVSHKCRVIGCSGQRVRVKWPDDRHTLPCSTSMVYRREPFIVKSFRLIGDSWLIGKHPVIRNLVAVEVTPNTDMTADDWKALAAATPREADGKTPMQMPCNWSVDDVTYCMLDEMGKPFSEVLELVKNRDLMSEILTQFQENLATHDWTYDMEDAIEHCIEEHRS